MRLTLILLLLSCCIIPLFGQTYTWDSFTTANSPLPGNNINTLDLGNDGILWIGSNSGLTGYNGMAWISYNMTNSNLESDHIRYIRLNDNEIYLGTLQGLATGQINTLNSVSWNETYTKDNSDLIHNIITSINIDSLGSYWVCTDSGITVISDTSWQSFTSTSPYLDKSKILSISQQPTQMQYIGTENGGVTRMYMDVDGISGASTILKQWTSFPDSTGQTRGLLSDTVTAVLVDRNGDRWFGTPVGLSFHTGAFLKNPYSWKIYRTESGLIHNNIQTLAEDPSGSIWIGTSGGLSKLNPDDDTWVSFTEEDGLPSNNIRDIYIADNATLWLATDAGLAKLTIISTAIDDVTDLQPATIEVYPAYPNPFNMSTKIPFEIKSRQHINISVFDINGRWVNTILNSSFMPGEYKVSWNGKNASDVEMSSGVYFVSVSSAYSKSFIKLVLIK